jgi:hypothetical protein
MGYLWIVIGVVGFMQVAVAAVAIRSSVLRLGARAFFFGVLYRSIQRSGDQLPRLSFGAHGQDGRNVRLPVRDTRLIIFLRPQCLASHRIARIIADQYASRPPDFSLTLVVLGGAVNAKRFAASLPTCVEVVYSRPSRIPRQVRSALPCAVSLGIKGQVQHFGKLEGPSDIVRFAEASGDHGVRRWCKDAFAGSARARVNAVTASASTISNLDVDSISSD